MPNAELTIVRGTNERTVPFDGRFVVGSSPEADLTLVSDGVAGSHLVIEDAVGWGTMVKLGAKLDAEPAQVSINGQPLDRSRILNHGDEVCLVDVQIVFREPGGLPAAGVFRVFQEEDTRELRLPAIPVPDPGPLGSSGQIIPGEEGRRLSLKDTGQFTWLESATLLDRCLSAFHQVAKLCGSCSSENQLLDAVLAPTATGLRATHGAVLARAGGELVKLFTCGVDDVGFDPGQLGLVLDEGRSISDVDPDGRPIVAVPILHAEQIEASLVFVRGEEGATFEMDELELATSIGRQVGSALERIRLLKGQRQRELEYERLQRRLETVLGSIGEGLALVTWGGRVTPLNPQGKLLLSQVGWEDDERIAPDSPLMWLVERAQERRGQRRRAKNVRHDVSGPQHVLEVSATLVEAIGAVVLVMRDVTMLRRMEAKHRETERKLRGEILEAGAREQQRLGQDIHDGLCQTIVAAEMLIRMLGAGLARQGLAEATEAERIAKVLKDAAGEARDLARGLSPVALEAHGLRAALEELADRSSKLYGVECILEARSDLLMPDPLVAIHLYYIAKEAVNNAVSHGCPETVWIKLSRDAEGVELVVDDDGVGFKVKHGGDRKRGMGFHIMRHRAEMVGAQLEVGQRSGGGARITVFVPEGKLTPSEDDD